MTPVMPKTSQGNMVWAGIVLAVLTLGLHGSALKGWWRWDDPQILRHALSYSPWEYFLIPAAWQAFHAAVLFPWLTLPFDIDLRLFGLNPHAFYGHHLLSLWVAALMSYVLLRLWLGPLWSGLGATLFLSGVPVTVVAQELMSRHYVEGLVFAILALYLFLRALRESRPSLAWWGGLFYLLAVSAKEVYVPLVLFLPFVPERDLRQRLRTALPFLLVAVAYVPWRWHMLITPVWTLSDHIVWRAVAGVPFLAIGPLIGTGTLGTAINLLILAQLGIVLWRRWDLLLLTLVALALITGPLVPVALLIGFTARYQLLPWWVFCCTVALLFKWIGDFGQRWFVAVLVLYVLVMGVVLYQGLQVRTALEPTIREFEMQGKFIWDAHKNRALLVAASPGLTNMFWYPRGLVWVKDLIGDPQSPRLLVDEIELAEVDLSRTEVWAYGDRCQCMLNVSENVPRMLAKWQSRLVVKPLSLAIDYRENHISWHFGPYKDGVWSVVNGQWMGKLLTRASGQRQLTLHVPSYDFYVRYDSPEGWTTYSSLLTFSPAEQRSLNWQR